MMKAISVIFGVLFVMYIAYHELLHDGGSHVDASLAVNVITCMVLFILWMAFEDVIGHRGTTIFGMLIFMLTFATTFAITFVVMSICVDIVIDVATHTDVFAFMVASSLTFALTSALFMSFSHIGLIQRNISYYFLSALFATTFVVFYSVLVEDGLALFLGCSLLATLFAVEHFYKSVLYKPMSVIIHTETVT